VEHSRHTVVVDEGTSNASKTNTDTQDDQFAKTQDDQIKTNERERHYTD